MIVSRLPLDEYQVVEQRAHAQAKIEQWSHYPQVPLQLKHHFLPGYYLRELFIPAGIITVSKIHKFPCLNILSKGERITTIRDDEEGSPTYGDYVPTRIRAPHMYWSEAGLQRISYTIEDAVWITQHWNLEDERDIAMLESRFVCATEADYCNFIKLIDMELPPCPS